MATNTWPASLPQTPLKDGYQEKQEPNSIETQTSMGPSLKRPRFTKAVKILDCTFWMTASQVETFEDFFDNTLSGGADKYDWTHPRTGNAIEVRFRQSGGGKTAPFSIENIGGGTYEVRKTVEIV